MKEEDKDDVVIEEETDTVESAALDPELVEGKVADKIAKMREELVACRKEKQDYMDGWQRSKADYVNALKRFENDLKAATERGKVQAVETLLPAFDALERAKEHGELPQGFLAIAKQLESAFASLGLEEIGKEGEEFDPALHEAFGQESVAEEEKDNVITAVLEKGWRITSSSELGTGGAVIRPAKVRVGQYKE